MRATALFLLLALAQANQAPAPTATSLSQKSTSSDVGLMQVDESTQSEESRKRKMVNHKGGKLTTLTIVQDFPKKQTEASTVSSVNLVQGKEVNDDDKHKTTLTIVQDFPKKQAAEGSTVHNVDLVQGRAKDIKIEED